MNKIIYDRLKALYLAGRASETTLRNAAARGWLTEKDVEEILGGRA